ncbi:hypothetical protein OIE91_11475 [Streptomyces albidoflavus]|uniref:zinc finger domain-containing protein n=1 Tax=Streptomyces albidoflavus TaxID=1886 RepID=UPI00352D4B16
MTETISPEEIGDVLGLAAARDQRTVGDGDVLAWYDDLNAARVTFADARQALTRFYVQQAAIPADRRFRVTTPDVIELARKIRNERVANFIYEPPADREESGIEFRARYRAQLDAVASGRVAAPPHRPALEGGPAPALVPKLRGLLRALPDAEDDTGGDTAPADAAEVSVGAMTVQCPRCKARIGRPCKKPSGRPRPPHPPRVQVAAGGTYDPSAERAEEQRRRAASEAALTA